MSRNGANGKPPEKTGGNSGRFQKGSDPRRGNGVKGRSGRKPNGFVAECGRLTDEAVLPKVQAYLQKAKVEPSDPTWRWCADYVTGYGKGKPTQPIAGNAEGDAIEIVVTREPAYLPEDDGE